MRVDRSRDDLLSIAEDPAQGYQRMPATPPASLTARWLLQLDGFFSVSARGSTLQTEVRSGAIAWMTMSYIMVVNPVILSKANPINPLPLEPVMTATALSAALGSLVVGVFGDAPLGLMPGMGLNAYFAFGICHTFGVSWQQALSCCFVSGALLVLLAVLGVSNWVVSKVLSEHLKQAITVAIGVFQALIGFQVMGLVVSSPDTLVTLGNMEPSNERLYLALAGFCFISAMLIGRVHGALLIGIWSMAACSWLLGLQSPPQRVFSLPSFDTALFVDFSAWTGGSLTAMVTGTLVMLFVALFDLAGVQYGLFGIAGLLQDGAVPRSGTIFSSAGIATMAGALLGTSPVIIANESSAGIIEGARTGLSAVVIAILFLLSAFIAPVLSAIPHVATAVPLVLIGAFMMSPCRGIDWDNLRVAIPSFLTITVVPFTYSIHTGIVAGIMMDFFLALLSKPAAKEGKVAEPSSVPIKGQRSANSSPPKSYEKKVSSPTLERLVPTPHGPMSVTRSTAAQKLERAKQLLAELEIRGHAANRSVLGAVQVIQTASPQSIDERGRHNSNLTEGEVARDEALLRALEVYIDGR